MQRILFVDDEPLMLKTIQAIFSDRTAEIDAICVSSGEEALKVLFQKPCQVVVTDLRMPGMDGFELLSLVMQRYPDSIRVIMSGVSDHEAFLRSVGTAHQFLPKPYQFEELRRVIDQALGMRDILCNRSLERLVSQIQSLPSLPTLYLDLVEELRGDDPSSARLGTVIAKDLGMCTKLLQLVNSAFFGLSQRISNVEEAVAYLGTETIKALVLYLHIILLFERVPIKSFSFEALWRHCGRVGALTRRIAQGEMLPPDQWEQAFIAGLLHDVGKVVLATGMPSQFQVALDLQRELGIPIEAAEFDVFGTTHAEVGAYLLGLWGLPRLVVEALAYHHCPASLRKTWPNLALVIHAANAIDWEIESDQADPPGGKLDAELITALGMDQRLDEWRAFAKNESAGSNNSTPGR